MRYLSIISVLLAITCSQVYADIKDANIVCVETLRLPEYTPLARNSGEHGLAIVEISINPKGAPSVHTQGVGMALQAAVRASIDHSTFNRSCSGKTVHLEFQFALKDGALPSTEYRPPNRFVITSSPGPTNQ